MNEDSQRLEIIESLMMTPLVMLNTSFLEQTSLPEDDQQMKDASAFYQHGVSRTLWMTVPPVLLVLGCYGNVMTIVVMRAMRASDSAGCLTVYFTALALSDLLFLCNMTLFLPDMAFSTPLSSLHYLSCTVPFFVSYVTSMTSAWCLVLMTCQRMLSIVVPHRVEILCTAKRGKILIAAILTTSCVANLYVFFHFGVVPVGGGRQSCTGSNTVVASVFSFLYLCLASVIPFLFLIVANSVLIYGVLRSVKMSGQLTGRADRPASSRLAKVSSMTTTLILTSAAFLVLTLPTCFMLIYFEVIGFYEGEIEDEAVIQQLALMDTVCLLLWFSNSSVNFYIYILSGRKFRQEAKRYLCLCYKQERKVKA